ncbi:glutamyl aminopeptidase-like isoform X5 [Anopheles albimanus]|uniref:glutamyl aminopeptidase-like isoform X5 n=1 Tax=Anopheles albimanus TaxID=7167 RepID=UPI00163FEA8C|nr:glutamyl aminopeptidase-like isoform X5 [Anopheles albimanus]
MVNQIVQQSKDWMLNNKVATFLSVALFAMVITTIALAVSNNNNAADLEECQAKIDSVTSTIAPTSETTSSEVSNEDTTTPESTTVAPTTIEYRLPQHNVPVHYDLVLQPNLALGTFTGRTTITIRTDQATDRVVLHSHLLDIGKVEFKCFNDTSLTYTDHGFDEERSFLEIKLSSNLGVQFESELTIEFSGRLDEQIVGFYSSSYRSETGTEVKIATSKFEPTFARQAFPCFDEPHLKAEYTVHLVHPMGDGYEALSNMNVSEVVQNAPSTGLATTSFERSVRMSTYLVVFIVSDFLYKERIVQPKYGESFPLRVYATPLQQNNTQYALDTAAKIIEHYVDYFSIPYPLPKLDMAAIPDFVSGAMETWGLVTYRETSILYNKETSSTANKQRVAGVIAHELAHMWFGNLVTMKWWNELWLNEGFASYIEYKGIDVAHPDWGIKEQFIIDDLHGVMTLDATLASHPIVVSVENPNQITEIFDTITYSKGASVIRMLEDFVSPPIFQQGVTRYLEKNKFASGVSEDLMTELDALVTEVSVTEVMDTFTKQKGLPVVMVEVNDSQYVLRQQRFLADQEAASQETEVSPYGYRWHIPLTYISSDNESVRRLWFPPKDDVALLEIKDAGGPNGWVKFNYQQVGYYRVNYPDNMWDQFAKALTDNASTFTIGDRTGLLNDAFALADASLLKYSVALELTRYLADEQEYVPWSAIASKLKTIRNLLYNYISYDHITQYTRQLVSKVVDTIGWDPVEDEHMKNLLRTTVLDLACTVGHPECLDQAGQRFKKWLTEKEVIHPDIRSIVYTYGIQSGVSIADWEQVLARYEEESDANEKAKLMAALTAYPDQRVMRRLLDLSWNTTVVRTQDQLSCIQSIAANRYGEQVAWEHVRENWERLVDRFTIGERNLGRMIPSITGRFTTQARLMELQDFFARYPEAGAGAAARAQALENIQNNINWLKRNEQNVATWLSDVPPVVPESNRR